MNPALQSNELSDGIMAKTELSANVGLPFTGSNSGTDFSDKISGQSFPVSTIFKRMLSVPFRSAPFKIGKGIVGADEISVVDLREIVGIGDKSKTHQAMNHKTLSLSRFISKSN